MALFNVSLYSEKLGMHMPVTVILPQQTRTQIGQITRPCPDEFPVLWLLHGLSDDHTIWLRRTRIDVYAETYGIAVIMPTVHRSFYQDTMGGLNYFNYACEELQELCQRFFRISKLREDNFVAGNSMGGYGAMRCALWRPDKFAAAYSFSGALEIHTLHARGIMREGETRTLFAEPENLLGTEADLFHLAEENLASNTTIPRLYGCCGKGDFLLNSNQSFAAHLKQIGIPYDYLEDEGSHDWSYWENHLEGAIKKLLGEA